MAIAGWFLGIVLGFGCGILLAAKEYRKARDTFNEARLTWEAARRDLAENAGRAVGAALQLRLEEMTAERERADHPLH